MGVRLKVTELPSRRLFASSWQNRGNAAEYAIDIQRDRDGEFFELRVPEVLRDSLDLTVLQAEPKQRHLLLLVRREGAQKQLDRFLCGHDERKWFVAAVPSGVSSVAQAKEALKPEPVRLAQAQNQLSARKRNARKNRAFRRQGEWFFIPAPGLVVDPKQVLRNEPLRRGAGKPHIVDELCRTGGVQVLVCSRHPNGLTAAEHQALIVGNPKAKHWGWRQMMRDPIVHVRGRVRHSDHATITLPNWHRVAMNTETQARSMANMAFLD